MTKPEKFIKDCTRTCSNELVAVEDRNGKKVMSYHEWLTPDQALRAVEIAREEVKQQMMKDSIECQVSEGGMCPAIESIPVLTNTDMIQLPKDRFKVGDKVRLVIIKAE